LGIGVGVVVEVGVGDQLFICNLYKGVGLGLGMGSNRILKSPV